MTASGMDPFVACSADQAGFAPLDFAPARMLVEPTPEGGYVLRSALELESYETNLCLSLRHWARQAPERVFLAERAPGGHWRTLSYAQAASRADALAQAFLDRGMGPGRPLMILSGNSINHALMMLGALVAGVPVAPVSVAYSLMSANFAKLRHIFETVRPALLFAENGEVFSRALGSLDLCGAEIVTADGRAGDLQATGLDGLLQTRPTEAVERAFASVGADTVAKYLFSSGSTGLPKGVINTHGMLCSNQQMLAQVWPFTRKTPPVLLDWLPWNHTFGGNHNFNLVLRQGGTLYIDDGKPAPGLVEKTLRNLAEVSPTIYFNVPAGYAMLLPHLERDSALRSRFFQHLQLIFYAGAALSQDLWQRLEKVAVQARGKRVVMTSSWGSTETAPLATAAHYPIEKAGIIGIPCPGVSLKLVPDRDAFELRVKGPNITPGYLGRPDLTAEAFDAEGFYRTGDAGGFADPANPQRGIAFGGRVVEDFKLATGTWVRVGALRLALLSAAPLVIQDALVAGQDRDEIGILVWPNLQGCARLCGIEGPPPPAEQLIGRPEVIHYLTRAIEEHNGGQTGSSTRIGRMLLMKEPPSIDENEITDKGYINQRAALHRRKNLVERLHDDRPGPEVIVFGPSAPH